MRRRLQRIGGLEIGRFQEQPAKGRRKENDTAKEQQESRDAHQILHRVVRVEGDAVERMPRGVLVLLDVDAVRIVGTRLRAAP